MADEGGTPLVPRWPDASAELVELARDLGWREVEPSADDAWVEAWEAEPGTLVAWYEDPSTDVEYALVHGPGRPAAEEALRSAIELLTPENYAAAVESPAAPLLRGRALMGIAVAARHEPPEPTAEAVIAHAMDDQDPFVRRFGIYAAGELGWPSLVARVEALRSDDPDPDVRATAAEVLE